MVEQGLEGVEDRVASVVSEVDHRLGCAQVPPAPEGGELAQRGPVSGLQQLPGGVKGRAEAALARGAVRVSLGWNSTVEDINCFADVWNKIAERHRARNAA